MGNESEIGLTEILVLWSALEMFGTTHLLINVKVKPEKSNDILKPLTLVLVKELSVRTKSSGRCLFSLTL